jgi:asparagine synthetase B (glutamine-hydrolysing)
MCGIVSFLQLDVGQNSDERLLQHMTEAVARLGPGGDGVCVERNLARRSQPLFETASIATRDF